MRVSNAVFALGAIHLAPVHSNPTEQTDIQMVSDAALSKVITGLYASNNALASVVIHDINGAESWKWSTIDAQKQNIPAQLLSCIKQRYAVPEAKWANGGKSILTIYNGAALMINHLPGDPQDKKITFGTCVNRGNLGNTHSLELVPDNKIAIATTSEGYQENVQIFDLGRGLQPTANPIEKLDFIPAVHGLVWDHQASLLWAVGSNNPPAGKKPSSSALNAYAYKGGKFQPWPVQQYNISGPTILTTEWAGTQYSNWWDGGHDVIGLPNKRQLLISTDMDLHVFNILSKKFESGSSVVNNYLLGFQPVDKRVGANGKSLPRSDIKSLSIDGNHNALYIQAAWKDVTSHQINRLANGKLQKTQRYSQQLYRSRWFQDIPGWTKANSRH